MYSQQDLVFSMSLAVYVAASVIVAAVRCGHKCEPYARHADYYYPACKTLVSCYLSNLVLLPAAFMPTDADAILLVRQLMILGSPFLCAAIMFSYFGKVLQITWWRKPIIGLSVPFALMNGTSFVLTLIPGCQLQGLFMRIFVSIAAVLSLAFLLCFVLALRMIGRALRRFSEANYSNPEDFPQQYAQRVLCVPVLHLAASWIAAYIATPVALSVGLLILSVLGVVVLIGVLSTHRAMDVEQLETGDKAEAQVAEPALAAVAEPEEEVLSPERQEEIERAIRAFVEDGQAYLDSHLTLGVLARGIGVNRTYASRVLSDRLGGFFAYVNRCRLRCAARLKEEQPDRPIAEIIAASGFGSRQTYYNVRRQLEG
jgi:AraC-like DNA-binding protein